MMNYLLFLMAACVCLTCQAQSVRPISITRTKGGTVTTLEFRDMHGLYHVWQDVSFDLRRWYHFDLGQVEGWGMFRIALPSRFWSVGSCAFWDYHLVLEQEEPEPVWEDYTQ